MTYRIFFNISFILLLAAGDGAEQAIAQNLAQLPPEPGRVGTIRRGPDGRITVISPDVPADASPSLPGGGPDGPVPPRGRAGPPEVVQPGRPQPAADSPRIVVQCAEAALGCLAPHVEPRGGDLMLAVPIWPPKGGYDGKSALDARIDGHRVGAVQMDGRVFYDDGSLRLGQLSLVLAADALKDRSGPVVITIVKRAAGG